MKLTAPRFFTWFIGTLLGVLAVLMVMGVVIIPGIDIKPFWLSTAGCGLLALGCLIPGM